MMRITATLDKTHKERFFGMILKTPIFDNYLYVDYDGHISYKCKNDIRDSFCDKSQADIHDHWWNHDEPLRVIAVDVKTTKEADKVVNDYEQI
ncbi:hypothetical protein [Escherichia phage FL20]